MILRRPVTTSEKSKVAAENQIPGPLIDLKRDNHYTTSAWMFHRLHCLGNNLNFGHQWLQDRCQAS